MSLKCRRVHYPQLTTGEHDSTIQHHELDLTLRTTASRIQHNLSTIQRYVNSGKSTRTPKTSGAYKCTSECTDRCIRQLTIQDPFSTARDVRSQIV
ncbi:hypothetical protein TNCV_2701621 [Trichonephila clavipes]|nr:hypothetical protein TNCV_2701621 [Trichonephila clavipes]